MTPSRLPRALTRRDFLAAFTRAAAGTLAAAFVLPPRWHAPAPRPTGDNSHTWLTLGPLSSLTPGVPTAFPFKRATGQGAFSAVETGVAYATPLEGGGVRVFSNVCTHEGCRVRWNAQAGHFACPCHHAVFAADGAVLAGPPTRPLEVFEARVAGGLIQIRISA